MLALILFLSSFLLTMFAINLKNYLNSPKYNKWVHGKVDGIDIDGEYEVWTIKWIAPPSIREKNPEGYQHYYVKFKHNKKWGNPQDKKAYLTDKVVKNISNKYFLALKVDSHGVIREIGKYDGYLPKVFLYGFLIIIFAGLLIWFKS